jgi:hypothetical protein
MRIYIGLTPQYLLPDLMPDLTPDLTPNPIRDLMTDLKQYLILDLINAFHT